MDLAELNRQYESRVAALEVEKAAFSAHVREEKEALAKLKAEIDPVSSVKKEAEKVSKQKEKSETDVKDVIKRNRNRNVWSEEIYHDGSRIFFTSDTHFAHANVLNFCHRPFASIEEHDEGLIERWNNVINDDDIVFHLGDFAFAGGPKWEEILKRLKGHIHLILGNHDCKNLTEQVSKRFESVSWVKRLCVDGQNIILSHYPFLCYGGAYRGLWNLFGHVHSGERSEGKDIPRLQYLFPTQYDVGVDNNEYAPVSFVDVRKKIGAYTRNNSGI